MLAIHQMTMCLLSVPAQQIQQPEACILKPEKHGYLSFIWLLQPNNCFKWLLRGTVVINSMGSIFKPQTVKVIIGHLSVEPCICKCDTKSKNNSLKLETNDHTTVFDELKEVRTCLS